MPLGWFDRLTFVGPYRFCVATNCGLQKPYLFLLTRKLRMIIKLRQIIAKGINITSNWLCKALSNSNDRKGLKTEKIGPKPQPEDSQVSQARLTGHLAFCKRRLWRVSVGVNIHLLTISK